MIKIQKKFVFIKFSCALIIFITSIGFFSIPGKSKMNASENNLLVPTAISVRTSISDEDWRHIANRYDLVFTLFSPTAGGKDLSPENERVKWIKSLNPNLKILVYGSAINAANFRLHSWKKPQEHPDWFLRDEAGEFVTDWEYSGALFLDPGNKEWQKYVASTLKDYIDRYGYDGVFLDLVQTTTHYINFKKTQKTINPNTARPYTDAEWKQANLDMLRTVRSYIGNKLLIINGSRGKAYFKTSYSDFFEFADGICNEGFTGWTQIPGKGFVNKEDWEADVDLLVDCAKRGKIVIAVANVKKRADIEPPELYDNLYRYITASFLLGMGNQHYLVFYAKVHQRMECYSSEDEVLPGFCEVSLGEPRGRYYQAQGVYQRDFERGKVFVNPTRQEASVKLDGAWKTSEGKPVVSQLTMLPHTGVILVRAK